MSPTLEFIARITELEAENALLQARVEEAEAHVARGRRRYSGESVHS